MAIFVHFRPPLHLNDLIFMDRLDFLVASHRKYIRGPFTHLEWIPPSESNVSILFYGIRVLVGSLNVMAMWAFWSQPRGIGIWHAIVSWIRFPAISKQMPNYFSSSLSEESKKSNFAILVLYIDEYLVFIIFGTSPKSGENLLERS